MLNRKFYRIIMTIACFVFAGLNAYRISTGDYAILDVALMVLFLIFGTMYLFILFRKNKAE